MRLFRFRTFRGQVLAWFLLLTGVGQIVTFAIVARVHRADAHRQIRADLAEATAQFQKEVIRHNADLARGARAHSFDEGMRSAVANEADAATLASALTSFLGTQDAAFAALVSTEGKLLAETRRGQPADDAYAALLKIADATDALEASGYAVLDETVYSIVLVPLRAPTIIAWIGLGFPLDQKFVADLKESSGVEISLIHAGKTLATTIRRPAEFVSDQVRLPLVTGGAAEILLQYSVDEKLAPAYRLESVLLLVGCGSLLLAAVAGFIFARGISEPVQQLAGHTRHIAAGDYERRIELRRADELGQLASSFNTMSAGLAERDRIRDLLDKNVSPEVAAQLLRDGATLGGQERDVTILFADLRGFTTMSETLPAPALLTLLNRYLDRMSTAIEAHGGVIDKFIGDGIMALFGAPVAQSDAPDRALAAALAMERALAELNREFSAEGRAPLAIGVGVNTARVVAGNIGSHRRLNYSVIGDGVNVASRLQAETRKPEYRTNIVTSRATLDALRVPREFSARPLGTVQVKGRSEPVEIFAIDPGA
jgi:adenylate cyclase